jgi:peptidyl-prolyl cis-trans isomerase C
MPHIKHTVLKATQQAALIAIAILTSTMATAKDPASAASKTAPTKNAQANDAKPGDELRRPFVTVDGQVQTRVMGEIVLREQLGRGAPNNAETVAAVRNNLIDQALMAKAGIKAGLDKDAVLEAQLELVQQRLLAQAWQRKVVADLKAGDKELRAEWTRFNEERGKREVRIRHLLVREEPTARLLVDKVRSGTPIAQLAADYSIDAATKGEGGLAPWTPEGQLIVGLGETVKSLKKGQLAPAAIPTAAGWHVIQLEDVRPLEAVNFEQIKPQLLQRMGNRAVEAQLNKLRQSAKIQ